MCTGPTPPRSRTAYRGTIPRWALPRTVRTAPYHTAPHRTVSHITTPHRITQLHRATPHPTLNVSHRIGPQSATPHIPPYPLPCTAPSIPASSHTPHSAVHPTLATALTVTRSILYPAPHATWPRHNPDPVLSRPTPRLNPVPPPASTPYYPPLVHPACAPRLCTPLVHPGWSRKFLQIEDSNPTQSSIQMQIPFAYSPKSLGTVWAPC